VIGTKAFGDPEPLPRDAIFRIALRLDETVPARRAITVEDVLTFRLGFGCIMAVPGTYPIHTAVEALDLKTLGEPWMYNTGSQVLGVLLERAAGQPLSAFLRERMFEPLGMKERSGR